MSDSRADLGSEMERLDQALLDLENDEAMLLDELDGFLTGIVVCPEVIMPRDWLHRIWGAKSAREPAPFRTTEEANAFLDLVRNHYSGIAATLMDAPDSFEPVISEDTRTGEMLWELWMSGFQAAMRLRPRGFAGFLKADEQTATAFRRIVHLGEIANRNAAERSDEDHAAVATAHEEIAGLIRTLHARRLGTFDPAAAPFQSAGGRVGRNDPCPCGSGKKYKKCCGLN